MIYVISMEFLWLSRKRSSSQNVPSGEEQREKAISAVVGLVSFRRKTSGGVAKCWLFSHANSCADFSTMAICLDCPHSDGELILC